MRLGEIISQASGIRHQASGGQYLHRLPSAALFSTHSTNRQAPQHSHTTATKTPAALQRGQQRQRHSAPLSEAATLHAYPTKNAADLQKTLLDLKATQHLNLSAFCRAAISEKLQRLNQQQEVSQ